jgi:peroxiredoxin
MAEQSKLVALGSQAPDFALPDTASGRIVKLGEFADSPAFLVAFLCNHCPYVKHVLEGFVSFAREYGSRGLAVVAISANDAKAYPDDAPPEMARLAKAMQFSFPYLYDESQTIAVAHGADLRAASTEQLASVGCSIKWRR